MELPPEVTDHPQWLTIAWVARSVAWILASLVVVFIGVLALLRWAPASRDVILAALSASVAATMVGNVRTFSRKPS